MFKKNVPGLVPVSRWNDCYDYPSVGSLRQLIFYNTNGFKDKVVKLVGKRQYIEISAFQQWVEETNSQKAI